MGKKLNLVNKTFGRLTVIKEVKIPNKDRSWLCRCKCGNFHIVNTYSLTSGNTQSCGCLKTETSRKNLAKRSKQSIIEFNYTKRKYNHIIDHGDYIEVVMKNGSFLTDRDDYEKFGKLHYWQNNGGYAETQIKTIDCKSGRRKPFMYHRMIFSEIPVGLEVDHINRNKLDNRKINLRLVTHLENMQNIGKFKHNTTGFPNISMDRSKNKFSVNIRRNGIKYFLGRFNTIEEARDVLEKFKTQNLNIISIKQ